jgi:hypothetical protein
MPLQQQRADHPSGRVVRWLRHVQAVFGIWAKINDVNDPVYMNFRRMLILVVLWVSEPGHVWMQRNQTVATLRTQLPYLYDIPFRLIYPLCRKGAACMTGTQGIDPKIASLRMLRYMVQVHICHCHGITTPKYTCSGLRTHK